MERTNQSPMIWLPSKELNGENRKIWIENACADLSRLCDREIKEEDIVFLPEDEKGWVGICVKESLTETTE